MHLTESHGESRWAAFSAEELHELYSALSVADTELQTFSYETRNPALRLAREIWDEVDRRGVPQVWVDEPRP